MEAGEQSPASHQTLYKSALVGLTASGWTEQRFSCQGGTGDRVRYDPALEAPLNALSLQTKESGPERKSNRSRPHSMDVEQNPGPASAQRFPHASWPAFSLALLAKLVLRSVHCHPAGVPRPFSLLHF